MSFDVRDVLEIPERQHGSSLPVPKRHKPDVPPRRFDGMQRELYSLLGENTPPVVVFENRFKERPTWNQKAVPWSWVPFQNPARQDGLELHHWVRGKHQRDKDDYTFAKFNQSLTIPQFTREEHDEFLKEPGWTYEETRCLFDLCDIYGLRWIVIHDRYYFKQPEEQSDANSDAQEKSDATSTSSDTTSKPKDDTKTAEQHVEPTESTKPAPIFEAPPGSRTIEDLKARFYDVSRKVLRFRHARGEAVGASEEELYRQMKYSKENEVKRKQHLESLLARSPAEIAEEEALVLESRKLEAAAEMMLLERAEILRILDAPATAGKISEYQTSQGLAQLTGQLLMSDKNKKRKDPNSATPLASPVPDAQLLQNAQQLQALQSQGTVQGLPQQAHLSQGQGSSQSQATSAATETKRGATKVKNEDDSAANTKGTKKGVNKKDKEATKKAPLTGSNAIAAVLHRKLSSKEEAAYGLSYHDKLSTGVYLRSSKITTYKQALQVKIHQVLAELGISTRPVMPTARVAAKFDSLQQSISVLLETKKQADKLETEIRVLRAQKSYNANGSSEENGL